MSKRVLVVDDEPVLLEMFGRWLTTAGHTVIPFTRFEDARFFLAHTSPDLLIADVRLGAFNGLHLALQLRHRRADVPIIVVSGYDDVVLRAEAARCGASFLLKPLTRPQLVACVNDAAPPALAI